MQTNKWRHLLLPVLVISQLATASQPASDTLTPQSEVKKDNALTGAGIPVSPPDAVRPADPVTQDNSFGRLEDIQTKTVLYEFQLAQAKALNELQKNGYDAVLGGPFNPQPAATAKESTAAKPAEESRALPLIVEISGGQQLSATLQLDGGNQVRVQAGSRIPGTAWTVAKITFGEVTVSSPDKGLISLAFAG
ncbi:type IV pilus biogenesis protein PilP [Pantoea vagans]|uniref:Type IV pilus biogenesis protein PilP n=1 Tax=Pantoea vagans TaxID=470934 RepID=A0AAN1TY07_9GAMM|nr:type IV pilus biogenesis protein PilP [Pantoea vagans]AVV40014.1 type IV pilus biogenesis protein PilP [Pantoea vagans]